MPDQDFDPVAVPPGTCIGPYRVLERLGRGGMGAVYRVERDGLPFALKLALKLTGEARSALEARVRREVSALAALLHPNVVRIHAFDRYPDMRGYLYLVMDFVQGERLYAWQDTHRPPLRAVAGVFLRVAEALQALHARGLHHRDIKSENVLVRADGEPILIDFGIARAEGARGLTRAGCLVGTATHVSPEYARYLTRTDDGTGERHTFGPTDDLHAVGVMLYEVLAGCPPFALKERNEWELLKEIAHHVPQPPRSASPLVPSALDAVVMKLLAKQPEERFQSGAELAQALETVLAAADASWDAPFELPKPQPPEKAPTRNGRTPRNQAKAAGAAIGSLLLNEPPAPARAAPPVAVPPSPEFRPPSEAQKRFESPEPVRQATSARAPSSSGELPSAIRAIGQHISNQPAAPRRLAVLGGSAIAGAALIAAVLATSPREEHPRPRTLLQEHVQAEQGGAPLTSAAPSSVAAAPVLPTPPVSADPNARPPLPVQVDVREPARRPPPLARSATSHAPSRRGPADDAPAWLKGSAADAPSTPSSLAAAKLGVPFGAHIRVRLKSNLDSRTSGEGLVEAVLIRPHVERGSAVLPSRTMLYGRAQVSGDRFLVQLTRLTLPDGTERACKGSALDLDGKPGLAAGRRIHADEQAKPGFPETLARTAAGTLLGQVGGNPAADAAGAAGRQLLDGHGPSAAHASDAVLLDAGADFDVVVQEAF